METTRDSSRHLVGFRRITEVLAGSTALHQDDGEDGQFDIELG